MEVVGHVLHLVVVVFHVEVALDEGPERTVELESAGLAVVEEPLLNGKPNLTSGATALTDDVLELDGERAEDPGVDDVVHPLLVGESGGNDMVVEGVALQRHHDKVAPAGIVVVEGVEDDGDQGLDVLDSSSLGVEAGDGGDFECVVDVEEEGHLVRNRTLTLIEREDDTRSWGKFLVYFSHSTTMPCPPRGWGYILIGC
jgi:hypothetical protein